MQTDHSSSPPPRPHQAQPHHNMGMRPLLPMLPILSQVYLDPSLYLFFPGLCRSVIYRIGTKEALGWVWLPSIGNIGNIGTYRDP